MIFTTLINRLKEKSYMIISIDSWAGGALDNILPITKNKTTTTTKLLSKITLGEKKAINLKKIRTKSLE